MYFPFGALSLVPLMRHYHKKLNLVVEGCSYNARQKKMRIGCTKAYYLFAFVFVSGSRCLPYCAKLLARLLSLDTLSSMWHTEQALTWDELTCSLADTVCLVLDAHECHLEVADELSLALRE